MLTKMRYLTKENGTYGTVYFLSKVISNTQRKMWFNKIDMRVCKVI